MEITAQLLNDPRTVYMNLLQCYKELADVDQIFKYAGIIIEPNNTHSKTEKKTAHTIRGVTLFQLGRHREAMIDFKHCVVDDRTDTYCLLYLAMTYYSAGDYKRSMKTFNHCLTLDDR